MITFPELADHLLAPLKGRSDEDWFRAGAGQWCAGQILEHLAIAMENSANGFAARIEKPHMLRRPRTGFQFVASTLVLTLGWFPIRREAPDTTRPATRPDRAATEARLRASVTAFLDIQGRLLPQRAHNLYLKHPVLGDLTVLEWELFHLRHAHHHRKQLLRRLGAA